MDCKYIFKIIIVGNSTVGKSSLLNRYIDNNFNDTYSTTIGVEFGVKYVTLNDNTPIKLQIWDTAGQESFRSITRLFYRASAGVILMYSIDNKNSFENLKTWLYDINLELNNRKFFLHFLCAYSLHILHLRVLNIFKHIKQLLSIFIF